MFPEERRGQGDLESRGGWKPGLLSPKEEGIGGSYLMSPTFPQLPFSVIGSLNGVHMFGQNLEVQLSSARTKDTTVVWKSFHDRSLSASLEQGQGSGDSPC